MVVIASAHIADVGAGRALRGVLKAPSAEGLRHADVGLAAALSASVVPRPGLRRFGLLAFWDGDDALDAFLADHPLAAALAGGWQTRLEPLRAFGTWPGLPSDIQRARTTTYEGPAVVFTLGRLRLSQTVRFLRTSAKAEERVLAAPGVIWATGMARPPFVATCSLWDTTEALSTYAYGQDEPAHHDAIAADRAQAFHHQSAFVRFRPYAAEGDLGGANPLPEALVTRLRAGA